MRSLRPFSTGISYTANPLGCAAALATLSIFAKRPWLKRVSLLSRRMAEELAHLREHPTSAIFGKRV